MEAIILSGWGKEGDLFFQRIPIFPTNMPFDFERLQFPIRLRFAKSIKKIPRSEVEGSWLPVGRARFLIDRSMLDVRVLEARPLFMWKN